MVETHTLQANVTDIDAANRRVTLVNSEGKKATVKCGPDIVNFDQIRVGDQLKVKVTEQLVVQLAGPGEATSDGGSAAVLLAPVGAKPGGMNGRNGANHRHDQGSRPAKPHRDSAIRGWRPPGRSAREATCA
jgi:hypothetical protein